MTQTLDQAFETFRKERFGAYAQYPIDAYTYFAIGWKAAIAAVSQYPDRTVVVAVQKLES